MPNKNLINVSGPPAVLASTTSAAWIVTPRTIGLMVVLRRSWRIGISKSTARAARRRLQRGVTPTRRQGFLNARMTGFLLWLPSAMARARTSRAESLVSDGPRWARRYVESSMCPVSSPGVSCP